MLKLLTGLVLFHGVHLTPTMQAARARWIERFGRNGYLGLFSVISLVALALIIIGYGEARLLARANPQLWTPPTWTRHIAYLLMLPAMILLVAAYVPSRIRDRAKHPMLASIKLWALSHLLVRGDVASLLLFGSFLAYGVYDRISVRRRSARGPLGDAVGTARGDVIVLVIGVLAYVGMVMIGHKALIGLPLLRSSLAS
jgi:uncharacterized membrane protein